MSKRYSLFKGAGAASIRRLGVLLAMLLSTAWYSVSYAEWGFFSLGAWDIKITTDGNTRWLYNPASNDDCRWVGASLTNVPTINLGEISSFTIDAVRLNAYKNNGDNIDNGAFYYAISSNLDNPVKLNLDRVTCERGGNDQEWANQIGSSNVLDELSISSPGNYELQIWMTLTGTGSTQLANNDGQNYKITFTIPQQGPVFNPSKTTMYFGNVPYEPNGEGKLSTVYFEYNGSTPLSGNTETEAGISIGSRGAFFEFVDIGNNGTDGWITYRFRPDETNSNKSFTNETHRISLTKDDEPLTVIFNASSFTPLIAGSREPVRAQSIAELSGAIMYTGCNTIEEYGVYYSTDPDFFDSATNTVDMSKSQVANVTGVLFRDPVDNLKVTVKGLMSGTTYYYIWYMKDSEEQTTFDAVLNFTTNEGDYRLAVNDAVAGTETYYGFIYEGETIGGTNDITTGYVQYWLSCTPRQTYRLQFNYQHKDGTYEWIDVPGQSGTIPSEFSQSYVRIDGTDLVKNNSAYANAKLSAPVQKEVPAADYTYNVYFTKADGSAVTGKDGSD